MRRQSYKENNVRKGTHLMEVGEKEGKHPLTNMSSLTQSHLIDCPLLLCNLGGFEFYKRNCTSNKGLKCPSRTAGPKRECIRAYLIFFSKG